MISLCLAIALVGTVPTSGLGTIPPDAAAPLEVRYPDASTLFHCDFDPSTDKNYDYWPDDWTRYRGKGFPIYQTIEIDENSSPPAGGRSLRIDLNGGSAAVYSPLIKVRPFHSFVLEGFVRTEGLRYDTVGLTLNFFDASKNRIRTVRSVRVTQTDGWEKLRLGPVDPGTEDVYYVQVGLHVDRAHRADLFGVIEFADLWLGSLPRISLWSNETQNIFMIGQPVEISCSASGFPGENYRVRMTLKDVLGDEIAQSIQTMDTKDATVYRNPLEGDGDEKETALIGRTKWSPPIPGQGFYWVSIAMRGPDGFEHTRRLGILALDKQSPIAGGRFGWSLPDGAGPMQLNKLGRLVSQSGINWVKYPLWIDEKDWTPEMQSQMMGFYERLSSSRIKLIGLLSNPPESLRSRFGRQDGEDLSAAEIFGVSSDVWFPSMEMSLARLSTQVEWWQLGDDQDTSFTAVPRLTTKLNEVKSAFDSIGLDARLALAWNWEYAMPQVAPGSQSWLALSLCESPSFTHDELRAYSENYDGVPTPWITLRPLSAKDYSLQTRSVDLVRRMMVAQMVSSRAAFCPKPFDDEYGLLTEDGQPSELFMVWRTMAYVMAGAKSIGSIRLPEGSANQIFTREDDAVMIVWNPKETFEELYLGDEIKVTDIWGRSVHADKSDGRNVLLVGPVPVIVTGLNKAVAQIRRSFRFGKDYYPDQFGRPLENMIYFRNEFPEGASGTVEMNIPAVWRQQPSDIRFRLADYERFSQIFTLTFPFNATSGIHSVRVDFDLVADKKYQFSVYRDIKLGLGNVFVEMSTHKTEDGELVVVMKVVNHGEEVVNYQAQLFAPGRRRQKKYVLDLGRGSQVVEFRYPDGKELEGKSLWLRAEEIDGPQIINCKVTVDTD